MSLELIREAIRVGQTVGEYSTQTVVENDIIVPDVKPDIARILLLDGDANVNNTEVMQDKALVNGAIRFKILYVPDGPGQPVKSINTGTGFSCPVNIAGIKQGMKCKVKCDIEHIEHSILNGRKINVKTIVKVSVKVTEEVEQEVISDVKGMENIQAMKSNVDVKSYIGDNESNFTCKEELEIPAGKPSIREILRSDLKITGKDHKVTGNKVIAKGELCIATLYIADDEEESIQFMEHEIPFTQFIDLPGADEECECETEYRIVDSQFEAGEDSDGELRVLRAEVALGVSATVYGKKSVEVLEDAYGRNVKLQLEKKPIKMENVVAEHKSQVTIKDIVTIEEGSPDIAEVFNVLCNPSLSEYKIVEEKVVVEGVVSNSVLYLAGNTEQPVFCQRKEAPFKQNIDMGGITPDMGCDVALHVEHCTYSMISASEVEIRLVVSVCIKVISQVMVPLVVKVTEQPLDDKKSAAQPSVIIYFSQPGDTLWKIAKKYSTTMEDIKVVNGLTDNECIVPGKQIIIPKKLT